ncbi:PLP-dependent aminotransferase family protein (plasmid) [Skermanella sp. TT6]|uniref:PLP-dependent aminotransferase family protein n=1 Tax=Skermanella cutis TaxID=2775420 RepID=A0ABX7BGT6_9PROT|nr:PLP-dependent aminotransferase family protein [Skermanella sp. TT6]QQP93595.1 PLP-dependent aminotransferase family protein [Skermanella sp. TT6]
MTEWLPVLTPGRHGGARRQTKHRVLTEAIIADIDAGRLTRGQQLPAHRELALRLGLSARTVSASYKEVERRGYLRSEAGRGTFVKGRIAEGGGCRLDMRPSGSFDLSVVRAVFTERHDAASRTLLAAMSQADNTPWMQPCRPVAGLETHRAVGSAWLAGLGLPDVAPDRILITNGTTHGIFLALATVVRSDDLVVTEALTDHGVIGLSNVLGFTLCGLPTDREGILPEAFEEACRTAKVKALVCTPTFTNPTGALMGAARRRRLAEVARANNVYIIEDEVYRPLIEDDLPSVSSFAPELGFFCTSFTKSVMTGLRTGYLVVPPHFAIRTASVLRVTCWSAVPAVAEMAARWVEDGIADQLLEVQRSEIRRRQELVGAILGAHVVGGHPLALSAWLRVPGYWTEEGLVRALRERGVAATSSEPFVVEAGEPPNALRICIGGTLTLEALREALEIIAGTFAQYPGINDACFIA